MSEVNPDKPCPFCGNPTVQTTVDDGCHWSSCPKCSATGPTEFLRSDEDSTGWNTRPDFDRVTAERDAALGREADLVERQAELREGITMHWQVVCDQWSKIDALQQRLTAADELNDTTKAELAWQESDNAELRKRVDVLEGLAVKQAALLDELGIPLDEVDDLYGETLKNAKRYEYLRSVMAVENFPAPHPEWSEPSEAESKRIDDLCDAATKP